MIISELTIRSGIITEKKENKFKILWANLTLSFVVFNESFSDSIFKWEEFKISSLIEFSFVSRV